MECAVALEETTRNLLMVFTWLPSLLAGALVFFLILRWQRVPNGLARTLVALLAGFGTLFGTWMMLLVVGGRIIC